MRTSRWIDDTWRLARCFGNPSMFGEFLSNVLITEISLNLQKKIIFPCLRQESLLNWYQWKRLREILHALPDYVWRISSLEKLAWRRHGRMANAAKKSYTKRGIKESFYLTCYFVVMVSFHHFLTQDISLQIAIIIASAPYEMLLQHIVIFVPSIHFHFHKWKLCLLENSVKWTIFFCFVPHPESLIN